MSITKQLAKHLREVHFGGNWSCSNLRDQLSNVPWDIAIKQKDNENSIATLSYHISYYVNVLKEVLEKKGLNGKDKESFMLPNISNQKDWEELQSSFWKNAEETAVLLEKMDENLLLKNFEDEKYGNYFRNILGIIEHMHYHLGQVALLKKIIYTI